MSKYKRSREGCSTATITMCGIALTIFTELKAKHKIATGRMLTNQQAFNYIMNDYNNLRNK